MKKTIAFLLAFALFCSYIPIQALAVVPGEDQFSPSNLPCAESRIDYFITEEVAVEIAKLFVSDMIETGGFSWDENTAVTNVRTMYDNSENRYISAYSVELSTGYIVVSAYNDVPDIVLEWSDSANPLYKELMLTTADKVIYCGAFQYFKDSGFSFLHSLNGCQVQASEITNTLSLLYDSSNIPNGLEDSTHSSQNEVSLSSDEPIAPPITDPYVHANENYQGPFRHYEHINDWDHSSKHWIFHHMSEYSGYTLHCLPTAILNLLTMYACRYPAAIITSTIDTTLFNQIAQIGIQNGYYYNIEKIGGSPYWTADDYILACCDYYNIDAISVTNWLDMNYANFKTTLTNDDLGILLIGGQHERYEHHFVVCYAYTRLISSTTGKYKTYLKVSDGWSTEPRYIDLATVTNYSYWEVNT